MIHQSQYIEEALATFNLLDSKPILIPLQPGLLGEDFKAVSVNTLLSPVDMKLYQRIIGTIMYLMTQTRPDISFSIQWLSRQLVKPNLTHLNAAKNLLRYLNGTKDLAICYGYKGRNFTPIGTATGSRLYSGLTLKGNLNPRRNSLKNTTNNLDNVKRREPLTHKGAKKGTAEPYNPLKPIGFSDSDFAGDKVTSKSTYGYVFILVGGPISWKSKRATTIALSTLEAETDGLTEAIREARWLKGLFLEICLPIKGPISLYGDNQGSISNAYNPNLHARTKHTLLKFRYVREQVNEGLVDITYLDTKRMPADGLTKPLASQKHGAFLELLGFISLKNPKSKE